MKSFLLVVQILIATGLVVLIILQSKGTGLGSAFGGSGGMYRSRRGVEKLFVYATIFMAFAFFVISILQVIL